MTTMQARRIARWVQMLLLAAVALAGGAHAQDTDVDPPGRVARLSEVNGQVWLYSPESAEWLAATRNQPLTTGDRLATEAGARAELQIGSTTVRIDASSELEIVQLDDEHVVLELIDGSVIARVRDLDGAGQLELGTEEGRFITLRDGSYRFDRLNGRSDVTVYSGQARYEGPNSGLPVNAGQRAEFWIDSGGVAQYSSSSPVNDAFAAWSNDRDRRFAGSIAERYVSPEMTGAAELDAYGRWEQTPDYGSVWIPTAVAADWAPYSQGRWTFVRPWGWTWVDDAPWGFAPFHYGRWVYHRNTWCWTPGTRVARPVYAPALVGWVGGARGSVSVGIGVGPAVGWFPLGPREVYVPSYRVSSRYARNLNITNVNATIITNVFRNPQGPREFENRRHPRAITVVPASVMAERRPVGPAAAQYRQAPWVRDIASDRGRAPALLAPQIATPPTPARSADTRGVRPPPGARPDARERAPGLAERPGTSPRDRNDANRERERGRDGRPQPGRDRDREPERGGFTPGQRPPGLPQQPNVVESTRPAEANRGAPGFGRPAPAVVPTAPIANPPTAVQPPVPIRQPFEPGRRFGNRDPSETPGANPRAPVAPVMPPAVQPASPPVVVPPPAPPQERPTMRALPVQRGDERGDGRGDGRRGDERRMDDRRPQRPELPQVQPPQPQGVQPPRVERSAPPPRPVDVPRPAAPAAMPAPPQPQPQAQQPAPPPRAEPRQDSPRSQRPDRADDTRRGDQR